MIVLTLPYPPSANVYWRTAVRGNHASTYVSAEAKAFKAEVARIVLRAGIRSPIAGRVEVGVQLFPHRPLDWQKRQRRLGAAWDDEVRCIDLDNANKVLLDSIKGIVIVDDGWPLRKITSERMEPDGEARVVLYVRQLVQPTTMQGDLLEAVA